MSKEDYKFCFGLAIGLVIAGMLLPIVDTFTHTQEQFIHWYCSILFIQAVVTIGLAHFKYTRKS